MNHNYYVTTFLEKNIPIIVVGTAIIQIVAMYPYHCRNAIHVALDTYREHNFLVSSFIGIKMQSSLLRLRVANISS